MKYKSMFKSDGGLKEGGVDAYRYMLEQNVGKSVLEFQVNSIIICTLYNLYLYVHKTLQYLPNRYSKQ